MNVVTKSGLMEKRFRCSRKQMYVISGFVIINLFCNGAPKAAKIAHDNDNID